MDRKARWWSLLSMRFVNARSARRVVRERASWRRVQFETLETRTLLSVAPLVGPSLLGADDAATVGEVEHGAREAVIYDRVRVALITPEYLSGAEFDEFMSGIQWPAALGEVPLDKIERLASLRRTDDDSGPYTTWIRISVGGDSDALAEMDSVEFYKLDSECVWTITPKAERLVNSMTDSGIEPVELKSPGSSVEQGSTRAIRVVVGLRTTEKISDLDAWLNRQDWPASLGEVRFQASKSLSMPAGDMSAGHRTIVSMEITGDIAGFEGLDFVEFVRIDEGLSTSMNAKSQRLLNEMTDSGLKPTVMKPAMAESGALIDLDDFNGNPNYSGIDGGGYSAVVIDTGADLDHPFFGPDNDSNGIADRIVYQYDFGDGDAFAQDVDGHGTNVAGIFVGQDATRPGVASDADIIILKVFGSGGTGLEGALRWVADHVQQYNIGSVNMSLTVGWDGMSSGPHTGTVSDYPISDELAAITAQNVTVVSASGNGYASGTEGVFYPSSDINSLSVGAVFDTSVGTNVSQHSTIAFTTAADRIAAYSCRDDDLTTILAAGSNVTSAGLGGTLSTFYGTSQAAPQVAGTVLLVQELAQQAMGRQLSPREFKRLIQETGVAIHDGSADGNPEDDNVPNTGLWFRRLDINAAADAVANNYVTYDAGGAKNDGIEDTYNLNRNGNLIEVWVNDTLVGSCNAATTFGINIVGSNDEDLLTVENLGDFKGVVYFDAVETAGTYDFVTVFDTSGDDSFVAFPEYSESEMEDAYMVVTTSYYADFKATSSGTDQASVYGDDNGENKFKGYTDDDLNDDNWVKMYRPSGYQNRAKFCESVTAYGNPGSADLALLYDNPGNDSLTGNREETHHYNGSTFSYRIRDFPSVTAYSDVGGDDRAWLADSVLEDEFYALPHKSSIYDVDQQVYDITVRNFEVVNANAAPGDNYNDRAKLHDASVPNDYVWAGYDLMYGQSVVQFSKNYGASQELMFNATGFNWVKCYSLSGVDYRSIDPNVLYDLYWDGSWTDV